MKGMFQKEIMGTEDIVSHRKGVLDGPGEEAGRVGLGVRGLG